MPQYGQNENYIWNNKQYEKATRFGWIGMVRAGHPYPTEYPFKAAQVSSKPRWGALLPNSQGLIPRLKSGVIIQL